MGNFNFRSVGKTTTQIQNESIATASSPVIYGIKTPLRCSGEHIFDVTYSLAEQVNDNLRNLILTNYGERVGMYKYGANLRPLLFDFVSIDDFDTKAITNIKSATSIWMPYVVLNDYVSTVDKNNSTKNVKAIKLLITYDVPLLNVKNKALEITLYVV